MHIPYRAVPREYGTSATYDLHRTPACASARMSAEFPDLPNRPFGETLDTGVGMRRRGKYSGGSSDFLFNLGRVDLPTVIKPTYREYASVLEPQVVAHYALQPEHLKAILQPSSVAALHALHSKISGAVPDEPRLSAEFPPEPLHPGEAPPPAKEPKWQDFEPRKQYANWFEGLKDVLSGTASARETAAKERFKAASNLWRVGGRGLQRAEQRYRERLQRYESDITNYRRQKAEVESDLRKEQQRFAA